MSPRAATSVAVLTLVERCRTLARDRPVALVAIDGPGGSGKSTLARRLADATAATVVSMDDFYRPLPEEVRGSLSAAEGADRFFDRERLRDEVLVPLRAGRTALARRFDWDLDRLGEELLVVEPEGVVIVEGVSTLRPELSRYWDLSVYLDVPRDVCRDRLLARGENSVVELDRWEAAERIDQKASRVRASIVLALEDLS